MKDLMLQFHNDEDGASATEYIILLILIACVILLIIKGFGSMLKDKYGSASGHVAKNVKFK